MITPTAVALRRLAVTGLLILPSLASAAVAPAGDPAARQLDRDGRLVIAQAGPFVQPGTYRIQVATKLGQPGARLADGTWLYPNRQIEGSTATGTLVVRFGADGRVSSLAVVTPAGALALRQTPAAGPHDLLATK